jgi:circadian clock protein KaiC
MEAKHIISTGIPSLDSLLGGGIPARQSVIVTGEPGTGKTILCSQIAFAQAAQGTRVVLATIASEAQDKLLDELQGFSFFNPERVGEELFMVSAYPWLRKGPKEAKELLLRTMRERKAKLLFLDGLRSLRDLWQSEAKLRDFMYELNVGLAQLDAIGLFTTEYPLAKLMAYPEATTVDGIVSLSTIRLGGRIVRRAQVAKLRGRGHLMGEHLMHITSEGIFIIPRIEETTAPSQDFKYSGKRARFGIPGLDQLLRGGLPCMSTTLMAGSTGVGKTLLSLHFAAAGATEGEPSLLLSYSEPVPRLVARARGISLDIEPLLASGRLHVEYQSPTNIEADHLIADILEKVRRYQLSRLVIDGMGELEDSVVDKLRTRDILSSFIIQLRDAGVTSIFIKEVPQVAGPSLDFRDTPIAVTAENLLFFRHVEFRGRLHRIVSVLKMRESGHDPYVREFEISDSGVRVLEPMDSAEGLLTGAARPIPPVSRTEASYE